MASASQPPPLTSDVVTALGLRLVGYRNGADVAWYVEYIAPDGNVGLRREALEPEVRMWRLLTTPQADWGTP